jgi:hypothetical protein
MGKGGPPRHFHYDQDEWFYAIKGNFAFEVGEERFTLGPGDALLAPRLVPHVWAYLEARRGAGDAARGPAARRFVRSVLPRELRDEEATHTGGSGSDVRRPRDEGRGSSSGGRLSIRGGLTAQAPLCSGVRGRKIPRTSALRSSPKFGASFVLCRVLCHGEHTLAQDRSRLPSLRDPADAA